MFGLVFLIFIMRIDCVLGVNSRVGGDTECERWWMGNCDVRDVWNRVIFYVVWGFFFFQVPDVLHVYLKSIYVGCCRHSEAIVNRLGHIFFPVRGRKKVME